MFYCNERLVFEYKVSNILILKSKDHSPILTFGIELVNYIYRLSRIDHYRKDTGVLWLKLKL